MRGDRLIVNQNYDKWKRYIHNKILRNPLPMMMNIGIVDDIVQQQKNAQ